MYNAVERDCDGIGAETLSRELGLRVSSRNTDCGEAGGWLELMRHAWVGSAGWGGELAQGAGFRGLGVITEITIRTCG